MTTIRRAGAADLPQLVSILSATVRAGASVGFLDTMTDEDAQAFWTSALEQQDAGHRIVLVAGHSGGLIGTVSVLLSFPANQPHRGEIAKLMVAPQHRGGGVGAALLDAAEALAWGAGKSLLVLDTESASPAEGLYARRGWTKSGEIPDYALTPAGRLHPTSIFWKRRPDPAA